MDNLVNALQNIERNYTSASVVERKISDYILTSPQRMINMTTSGLATQIGVSEGSIIRYAKTLGFSGFTQLKINIAQNLMRTNRFEINNISVTDTPHSCLAKLAENTISAIKATCEILSNEILDYVAQLLIDAKRIEIYGIGSSSMVAMDAYYRLMRIGLPIYAVTDPHIASVSASMLDEKCVAIAVSHTGRTRFVLSAIKLAKSRGAHTIAITGTNTSPLTALCEKSIIVVSREAEMYQEAVISRLSQLLIFDSLCAYISCHCGEKFIEVMENSIDIINEHRK